VAREHYSDREFESRISEKPRPSMAEKTKSQRPQKSQVGKIVETPFQRYMKKNYVEHFRRVVSWRRAARWVLLTYPLFSSLVFAAPFALVAVVVKRLYRLKPEWFTNVLSVESQEFVMPVLIALAAVALVFGFLTGVVLGISRARLLTFEAERTELSVRQSYFLKRIARGQSRTRPRGNAE
jgi:hypothetical protein